jgi:DNA-binding Lrp family transcriptional regulator
MLTDLEKQIIAAIQEDMAITERPYLEISKRLGITEDALLETLQSLCDRGIIRRYGATLRHQKTGFTANAMAAWQVAERLPLRRCRIATGAIPPRAGPSISTP